MTTGGGGGVGVCRVAYSLGDTLAVLDVDTGVERVVRLAGLPGVPALSPFTPRNGSPTWSRDGARITFVNTAPDAVRGDGRIWEVSADGGVARALTEARGGAPTWSPDGARLAFVSRDAANKWQVWVQLANGGATLLTSQDDVGTHRVRWTPDGRSIVYSADGGLWRVSPDGGSPARIPFRARVRGES